MQVQCHGSVDIGVERGKILFKHLSAGTEQNCVNVCAHCPSAVFEL